MSSDVQPRVTVIDSVAISTLDCVIEVRERAYPEGSVFHVVLRDTLCGHDYFTVVVYREWEARDLAHYDTTQNVMAAYRRLQRYEPLPVDLEAHLAALDAVAEAA